MKEKSSERSIYRDLSLSRRKLLSLYPGSYKKSRYFQILIN